MNLEGVLLGNNLQFVLYDWCEAAELQLVLYDWCEAAELKLAVRLV